MHSPKLQLFLLEESFNRRYEQEQEPEKKKREIEIMASHGQEDRISNLPEPIIHYFMSFLPTTDSTRTSILSKKWKSIWDSYPILDFSQHLYHSNLKCRSPDQKRQIFLNYLRDSIQRRQERKVISIQKFSLEAHLRDLESDHRVDMSINFAVENNVKELDLDITFKKDHLFYNVPESLYLAKSVTSLNLKGFNFDFQDLLSGCTFIRDLSLHRCYGWRGIKIPSDHKLTKLELDSCEELDSIEIESTHLHSFLFGGNFKQCNIDLYACRFLKSLSLKQTKITGNWLENHISMLLFLENLKLDGCIMFKKVKVFHKQLKSFQLIACNEVVKVEIDTPKLVSFFYKGGVICFGFLNSSGSLEATLSLSPSNDTNDYEWFAEIRTLLGLFGHCKKLKLVTHSYEDLIFPQEFKNSLVPPLYDLKHLEIGFRSIITKFAELLDSLLWLSPHMETLLVYIDKLKVKSIKFQYEDIMPGDEDPFCWEAHPVQYWQHHLTSVVLDNFDDFYDHKQGLLELFCENAKRLESIRDNSKTFQVIEGKYIEKI